ncbi:MAG: L-aspartate oxidase, partial [Pseudomonadota bacterium]|nr:L-aspartate oxidase [Pseudomonadota bacterium]
RPRPMRSVAATPAPDASLVRPILSRAAGVLREGGALSQAVGELAPLALAGGPAADPARVGLMIALAALRREESRGAHWRTDFPVRAALASPSRWTLNEAIAAAHELAPPLMTRSA